jgi:transposase
MPLTGIDCPESIRAAFPDDRLRICWDGASYHRAGMSSNAHASSSILITPLPAYSPDFMPVEALWRWMREEVTYNHCPRPLRF